MGKGQMQADPDSLRRRTGRLLNVREVHALSARITKSRCGTRSAIRLSGFSEFVSIVSYEYPPAYGI